MSKDHLFASHDSPEKMQEKVVLGEDMGGGPLGLGDPDSKKLRSVEKNVMVPKIMKERARKERCELEVKAFNECGKKNGMLLPFVCRAQNNALTACLDKAYHDEKF